MTGSPLTITRTVVESGAQGPVERGVCSVVRTRRGQAPVRLSFEPLLPLTWRARLGKMSDQELEELQRRPDR
jgi:hypothetical protein